MNSKQTNYIIVILLGFLLLGASSSGSVARLFGKINGEWRPIAIDSSTHGVLAIDHLTASVHEGDHYYVAGYETEAAAGIINFIVVTPDTTTWAHMDFLYAGNKGFHVDVYEGATFDAGTGNLAVPVNSNRNSVNTSVLEVRKDPDNVAIGAATLLQSQAIGPSTPGKSSLGGAVSDRGLVLKQDTIYLFRVTSDENDNVISHKGFWGEHVDEN